jgi:DNA polymerase epsilon subunit 1
MVTSNLLRKFDAQGLKNVEVVKKQDLDALNHLGASGSKGRTMFKLSFDTVQQLMDVRKELVPMITKNQLREKESSNQIIFQQNSGSSKNNFNGQSSNGQNIDPLSRIVDIREYDVPYLVRVCIDLDVRVGAWYTVTPNFHDIGVTLSNQDIETKAEPKYLAFDIECTKAPLKFPDSNIDSIFMISYMVDGQGYLIISRDIVGSDVNDFEYTPKPNYPGPFKIFNEINEEGLIRRFLDEYKRIRPHIVVTYNGDFFDWPYLEARAALFGFDLRVELGVERVSSGGSSGGGALSEAEYRGRTCVHLDAFSWVKRDSYLPQGSQGLKAVTKYKLGYDPVEVDPEDMVRFARERPVHMASYSVSDAVATYYLYEKYVHMFIFSLCTIIPMGPEDVLRKGSGTLCEALLMVQACTKDIICPNKQKEPLAKFHQGHLLESETYIGGKVECLETGVYRSDIEYKFDLKPAGFQSLIDNIDRDLTFAIEVEGGIDRNTVTNYDEVSNKAIFT